MPRNARSGYWPSTVPGAGAREVFAVTCRALRALERYGKLPGKDRQVRRPVALGVEWLVSAQSEEGDWKDQKGNPYPLPHTGLAALVVRRAIDQGCVSDTSKGGKVVVEPGAAGGPAPAKPAGQGMGEPPRRNQGTSRGRSHRTIRGSLPLDPSAYTIDCEAMNLLCNDEPLSPPETVRDFLLVLAYHRRTVVTFDQPISGEEGGATAREGRRELGRFLGPDVAKALVIRTGKGYQMRWRKGGVKVRGLGEAGIVPGHRDE